jgi:nitroreductase
MDAIEALKTRRTVRVYADKPVSKDVLTDLVDIARLSPSGMNEQPWEFVVVTDAAMRQKIHGLITHAPQIAQAPACIVVLCKASNKWYVEDGSAATMAILLGAKAHGLGSCWIDGDKQPYADAVRELVGAGADYRIVSVVTVGHAQEIPNPEKRTLEQVVHWERF